MNKPLSAGIESPIQDYLEELYREIHPIDKGAVATYIPELAKANPDWFGICLVTATGSLYAVGQASHPFTIQSISKPLVYGLALEDHGRAKVMEKVGVEPTGDAFNSISLDPVTGRPLNPMINAGAIASTGLVEGKTSEGRFQRILDTIGLFAGRNLEVDESVYQSENLTGHRNRAIGHMLRNFDILDGDPEPVVDRYFRQCSIQVNCRDLGVMAATLANRGVNPLTGRQAIRGEYVESVLSVMGTCGMYDYAGSWIYHIGMPAKSGVSGGIMAVLPGQLGIGVYSPRLDEKGNSVRGIRVCDELSRHLDLHLFNRPSSAQSSVRACFTGSQINSSRVRTSKETRLLEELGDRIQVYQLQGNLTFVTTEVLVKLALKPDRKVAHVVLDLLRILSINESACRLLYELIRRLDRAGTSVLFTHAERFPLLRRFMKAKLKDQFDRLFESFEENDQAMEWCENQLLESASPGCLADLEVDRTEYDLFQGLTNQQVRHLETWLERRSYRQGEVVVRAGEDPDYLYLVAQGRASVMLESPCGTRKRLASFSAGMTFGEMAVTDRAPRSATVVADTDLICDLLTAETFDKMTAQDPLIKIKMLENLCLSFCRKLRKTNRELMVLE